MEHKKITNEKELESNNETIEWLVSGVDLDSRRIELRGEVNENMSSIIIRSLLKMSEKSSDPIEIYLSSHGGDAYEGLAIFDAILACPCDIHIIASGKIMSAAFIIFLAGDIRIASPNTTFMMHSVSYGIEGTVKSREHEVQVIEGKRINNVFLDIMANRTNRNKKYWYRTILNVDKYLTVAEAVELGIIKESKQNNLKKGIKNVKRKKVRRS